MSKLKTLIAKKNLTKGQAVRSSDVKKPKMVTELVKVAEVQMNFMKGQRTYSFTFRDGVMIRTETNLPYQKTLSDWEFFSEAIELMLRQCKRLGYNSTPISGIETDIPF